MKRRFISVAAAVFLSCVSAVGLAYCASPGFRIFCSYFLAVFESRRLECHPIKTRTDAERELFWVTTHEYASLSNLFAASFLLWDKESNGYIGNSSTGRVVYRPQDGDQYVSYRVLGRMPFDFIYDKRGQVIYWSPSFDY